MMRLSIVGTTKAWVTLLALHGLAARPPGRTAAGSTSVRPPQIDDRMAVRPATWEMRHREQRLVLRRLGVGRGTSCS